MYESFNQLYDTSNLPIKKMLPYIWSVAVADRCVLRLCHSLSLFPQLIYCISVSPVLNMNCIALLTDKINCQQYHDIRTIYIMQFYYNIYYAKSRNVLKTFVMQYYVILCWVLKITIITNNLKQTN